LFAAMSVIWGIPYLLISVAVDGVSPPVLVATRTGFAALVLVPLAVRKRAVAPALARWRPLLAFTALEMAGPWLLLSDAERHLPSSIAGLLVASVPLVAAVVGVTLGNRALLAPSRLLGLGAGLAGVACVVGIGREGGGNLWNVVEVLLVAVGYAIAPFIVARGLAGVPTVGVIACSLTIVAVGYLPFAVAYRPDGWPPADSLRALVGLTVVCTGVAFIVFFTLIDEVGPDRATLFTFVNPVVAVTLGIVLLDEPLTAGLLVGFPLVLTGCWLAARPSVGERMPEPLLPTPVP
jgi:drug/metabolite transporter (DMT)-like permease